MDEGARIRPELPVGATFADAWRIYRLLFLRSVTTAAVVYAAIALVDLAGYRRSGASAGALGILSFVLEIGGPVLVQGALVEIVRNVHAGRPPERIGVLFRRGGGRFWPLLGASLLYGFGVAVGLVLLIVPGLLAAARWALIGPLVMLERRGVFAARDRSRQLVLGRTGAALACVLLANVLLSLPIGLLLLFHVLDFGPATFVTFVWDSLTAPYQAHVLTVIYYRLADPGRPVIDPEVLRWRSVWEGR